MDRADFEYFQKKLEERTGVQLKCFPPRSRRRFLMHSLRGRVEKLGMRSYGEYRRHLRGVSDTDSEWKEFVDSICIHRSAFFRGRAQFDYLATTFLPKWRLQNRAGQLRAWSAGCGAGEEAVSLAMTCARVLGRSKNRFHVLATDVNSSLLAFARLGVYPRRKVNAEVPLEWRGAAFKGLTSQKRKLCDVRASLACSVSFVESNLLESPPTNKPFDIIFCRNVLYYFTEKQKARVIEGFSAVLSQGGLLALSSNDGIVNPGPGYSRVGPNLFEFSNSPR